MEYCGGGDLSGLISQYDRNKKKLSEVKVWSYTIQMLHALQVNHLHILQFLLDGLIYVEFTGRLRLGLRSVLCIRLCASKGTAYEYRILGPDSQRIFILRFS